MIGATIGRASQVVWLAAGALGVPAAARAQAALPGAAATATNPVQATPAAVVTRADLAAAYRAFDRAVTANPPAADRLGALNTAFDQATLMFFAGRYGEAVRRIHELTARVLGDTGAAANAPLAAYRATVEPRVIVRGARNASPAATVSLTPLYGPASASPATDSLHIVATIERGSGSPTAATALVAASRGLLPGATISAPLAPQALRPLSAGRYRVTLRNARGLASTPPVVGGEWFVTDRDPDSLRADFQRRALPLDTIVPAELLDAVATFKARTRNLTSTPSPASTTQMDANPAELGRDLDAEFRDLVEGVNPYANRAGHLWRVLKTATKLIPLRTYVPVAVARARVPAPLVIALHGVGGDENMFPEALGAGLLVRLADQHGFVVASPNTDAFAATAEEFDALVAALAAQVPIDRSRVYVIGHSRGAGQAFALAASRADAIAGVVCIAGLGRAPAPGSTVAPTLAFLAELDPIAQPARLKPVAEQAAAAGLALELRIVPQQGHTLVVSASLPAAIEWLLPRRRALAAPRSAP